MNKKIAIIIGAGPAGLTAAYELLQKSDITPIVFESSDDLGGLAKTVNYKGNRIDIGGHRFFSKSDRVMEWWNNILPLQAKPAGEDLISDITYHNQTRPVELSSNGPDPEKEDKVMLIRNRLSRIFFLRRFFNYPISLNLNTVSNLGLVRMIKIGLSYLKARLLPIGEEKSLEDFFINRFGRELYLTFFKDYTEKVWGVACNRIKPEWGAQRVKGLSLTKTMLHALTKPFSKDHSISQKGVETSLIDRFLYPKYGPGQMWDEVAKIVLSKGGELHKNHRVIGLKYDGSKICQITVRDEKTGRDKTLAGDYFFSTMPVKELINGIAGLVPDDVKEIANGLVYRDFITVGLLLNKLKIKNQTKTKTAAEVIPDNWIYIQEPEVKVGRLQIFNNWSPYLVKDPDTVWIGCEYFCNEGDELWSRPDADFISFAINEMNEIEIIDKQDVLDSTLIRMKNSYPAYFGSYDSFHVVRDFTDKIENLFLVGRNGMHRYNNQDHSMLTAMVAVENIINGVKTKDNIWAVNLEGEYIEDRITAVENLTQGLLKKEQETDSEFSPDVYWEKTEVSYPAYPTVRHRKRFITNALRQSVNSAGEVSVFDYGMGEGDLLVSIKNELGLADNQLGGCDISARAVDVARRKIASEYLFCTPLPKLDRKFKVIICSEVIEHTKDYLHILYWLKANLEQDGLLILTTQSGKIHQSDLYAGHTQHFRIDELERILNKLEFSLTYSSLWGFPFFTLQKYLTDISFQYIKNAYLEGELSAWKKAVFDIAYHLFFVHGLIKTGPQIYILAVNSQKESYPAS